jgi:hypothetical protein
MASLISGNRMFCTNCKGEFLLVLPIGLTEACVTMRAFIRLHKECYKHYPEKEIENQKPNIL